MAKIGINIPNDELDRIVNAVCGTYGYPDQVENPSFDPEQPEGPSNERLIDNPVSRRDFAENTLINWLSDVTVAYEIKQAKEAVQKPNRPNITKD